MLHEVRDVTGNLVQALGGMFRMRGYLSLKMADVIQPVIGVDGLMAEQVFKQSETADLQGGGGVFVSFAEVPEDEEWVMQMVFKNITTGGTSVVIESPNGVQILYNAATAGQDQVDTFGCRMSAGWKIGMMETGQAGDAARWIRMQYLRYRSR